MEKHSSCEENGNAILHILPKWWEKKYIIELSTVRIFISILSALRIFILPRWNWYQIRSPHTLFDLCRFPGSDILRSPHFKYTFSAFWLRSSVVSVLISVTTDMLPTGSLSCHINFLWGELYCGLPPSFLACRLCITLLQSGADPLGQLSWIMSSCSISRILKQRKDEEPTCSTTIK